MSGSGDVMAPKRRAPRPKVKLKDERISEQERANRDAALSKFRDWLEGGWDDFLGGSVEVASVVLAEYGQHLYDEDKPISHYRATLLGVQDLNRTKYRWRLSEAWDILRIWEFYEPSASRVPMPESVLLSGVVVAILLGWWDVAACFIAGWIAGLRPAEIFRLCRANLVIPGDLGALNPVGSVSHVIIEKPKRPRISRSSKTQHVRVEPSLMLAFLVGVLDRLGGQQLWPLSPASFRSAWDCVFGKILGLRCVAGEGFTPGSLRSGIATHTYSKLGSLEAVRLFLRHQDQKTTEVYVQTLGVALAAARIPPASKRCIELLATAHHDVIVAALTSVTTEGLRLRVPLEKRQARFAKHSGVAQLHVEMGEVDSD